MRTIAALDEIAERSAANGVQEIAVGMAHRGRLNVLANIIGKPLHQVFAEFEEAPNSSSNAYGSGDVKYHLGAQATRTTSQGTQIQMSVAFNPSHLEAVDPVVEGIVRASQDTTGDTESRTRYSGVDSRRRGVCRAGRRSGDAEPFKTGGVRDGRHDPRRHQQPDRVHDSTGRSPVRRIMRQTSRELCSAPIWHVNGDDPEAVVRVAQMAYDFRQQFKKDVVVDIVCYRRHGHNEG